MKGVLNVKNNILSVGDKCIQCHACENVCPKQAIHFIENGKGFISPAISSECINCGLCFSKCPVSKQIPEKKPISSWHGHSKNNSIRMSSSSGGLFFHLANYLRKQGWLVIAVVFDSTEKKCKYVTSDDSEITSMQKSKYCESDFSVVIPAIRKAVADGINVFVCGTPCHIYSIKAIFGDYDKLFLVDFLCHGVPSRKMLEEDLLLFEQKYKSTITNIDFRFKESKYDSLTMRLDFSNGKVHIVHYDDDRFYYAFQKNWILRDSCYNCSFSSSHFSDITIGDFWQSEKYGINVDYKKGHSLIYANTPKGEELLNIVSTELVIQKTKMLIPYLRPSKRPADINKQALFFEYYNMYGFKKSSDKLFFSKIHFKNTIKKILRKK